MNQQQARQRFLRSAIKTALRSQDRFLAQPSPSTAVSESMRSEGVATLQKIRASLQKRGGRRRKEKDS